MLKLVGLLILVLAVAVILSDVAKMRDDARSAERERRAVDEDPVRALPIVRGQNDPYLTSLQSQLEQTLALLPAVTAAAAGTAATAAARSVVSSEVGVVRGAAGAPLVTHDEVNRAVERALRAAEGAGSTAGTQAAGPGAAIGGSPVAFLAGVGAGFERNVTESARAYGWKDETDIPIIGAFFSLSDRLTGAGAQR